MDATTPSLNSLIEKLGYVQCSFCNTILLVSVPYSNMLKVVTVKCGHCSGLLSVTLVRAPLVPLQLLPSLGDHHAEEESVGQEEEKAEESESAAPLETASSIKPPEKRQRAPSAYNCFIKEEIQRIKAREPTITHKEAFGTAAKNWAQYPRFRGNIGENCSDGEGKKKKKGKGVADEMSRRSHMDFMKGKNPDNLWGMTSSE